MIDPWSFAREIWHRHFDPPLLDGYATERVEGADLYFKVHEELRRYFPPEVFFDMRGLLSDAQREALARLAAAEGRPRPFDGAIVRAGDQVAAVFCGHPEAEGTYRMWHSHVHPAHRRRGLYRRIVERTLAYTRDLGFHTVTSEHAPGNNAILIAKLKAGFRIAALEVDPAVGTSVRLKYFHNQDHLRAYEFRCGLATLDDNLLRNGAGAMPLLIEQVMRFAGRNE